MSKDKQIVNKNRSKTAQDDFNGVALLEVKKNLSKKTHLCSKSTFHFGHSKTSLLLSFAAKCF